jgi:hypothetical protein
MGRTLPTYTQLIEKEKEAWRSFRRALRAEDQEVLDDLFRFAKTHAASGAYASKATPFESMLLSMLLEEHKLLQRLEKKVKELEEKIAQGLAL